MHRPLKLSLLSVCASVLLLVSALILATPVCAHAEQAGTAIESTLTITMQKSSDDGSADKDASTDTSTPTDANGANAAKTASDNASTTASSGKTPATGDALPITIVGAIALAAAAVYCALQGKKLAFAQGVRTAGGTTDGLGQSDDLGGVLRRVLAVVLTALLVAGLCLTAFTSKALAQVGASGTQTVDSGLDYDYSDVDISDLDIACSANIVIDEEGNVLSAELSLANNSEYTLDLLDLVAPEELTDEEWEALIEYLYWGDYAWDYESWGDFDWDNFDWDSFDWDAWYAGEYAAAQADAGSARTAAATASAPLAEVNPGETATGTWTGDAGIQVPASVVSDVRSSGRAKYNFSTYMGVRMYAMLFFDANAPSGTTATLDGKNSTCVKDAYFRSRLTTDAIPEDSKVTCSDSNYIFMGWAESRGASVTDAKKSAALASSTYVNSLHKFYYAVWGKIGDYWLNVEGAENPEAGVLKIQSQIDEDMEVLHGTRAQTSAGKDKAAVAAEYTSYMDGTSSEVEAGKEVHLYTRWNGEGANGANQWVEFRVAQVGEHDGDGSAVTFVATHSLPSAKQLSPTSEVWGSWDQSAMRLNVFPSYVAGGLKGLSSSAITVSKRSRRNDWDRYTNDKFWLLSNSEVYGSGDNNKLTRYTYWEEGSQYTWFANKGVNAQRAQYTVNPVIAAMGRTRSGSNPINNNGTHQWWLRSPVRNNMFLFGSVDGDGRPIVEDPKLSLCVVPAFCM